MSNSKCFKNNSRKKEREKKKDIIRVGIIHVEKKYSVVHFNKSVIFFFQKINEWSNSSKIYCRNYGNAYLFKG